MKNKFQKFHFLSLIFFIMVPLGTLLHESGHYLASKYYKLQPCLHYASVTNDLHQKEKQLTDSIIHSVNLNTEQKKELYDEVLKLRKVSFNISLAGPLLNMGLGSICFLILLSFGSKIHHHRYKWWFIFGSFMWSRQIINFMMGVLNLLINDKWGRSDETKLSHYMNLPVYFFELIFAVFGSIILLVVYMRFMNRDERVSFVLAGIIGGGFSTLIWFKLLGPYCLP